MTAEQVRVAAMRQGYVAFLDVLGFRELVARDHDGKALTDYIGCVRGALTADRQAEALEYVIFSDSLIVNTKMDGNTKEEREDAFLSIVSACSQLFGRLLKMHIPVRGAISVGRYVRSEERNGTFVAGPAIVEAYQYETAQNWTGIMLCPSVAKEHPRLIHDIQLGRDGERTKWPWPMHVWATHIPFHGSRDDFEGFAILPTRGDEKPENMRASLRLSMNALNSLKSWAPTPEAQQKHQRAADMIKNASNSWGYAGYHES